MFLLMRFLNIIWHLHKHLGSFNEYNYKNSTNYIKKILYNTLYYTYLLWIFTEAKLSFTLNKLNPIAGLNKFDRKYDGRYCKKSWAPAYH